MTRLPDLGRHARQLVDHLSPKNSSSRTSVFKLAPFAHLLTVCPTLKPRSPSKVEETREETRKGCLDFVPCVNRKGAAVPPNRADTPCIATSMTKLHRIAIAGGEKKALHQKSDNVAEG